MGRATGLDAHAGLMTADNADVIYTGDGHIRECSIRVTRAGVEPEVEGVEPKVREGQGLCLMNVAA